MALYFHGEDILQRPEVALALEGVPVRAWDDHGLQFTNAQGGVRKASRKPSIFTLHWTGGTGGGERVFHTLARRKTQDGKGLSVQLFVDHMGVVWQFADLAARCRHATATNAYGPGCEIQGLGIDRTNMDLASPHERIHGRLLPVLPFTEPQYRAVRGLAIALTTAFKLPRLVPGALGTDAPFAGVMPPANVHAFRGVLGHLHVSRQKLDPGLEVFRRLVRDAEFAYAPQA